MIKKLYVRSFKKDTKYAIKYLVSFVPNRRKYAFFPKSTFNKQTFRGTQYARHFSRNMCSEMKLCIRLSTPNLCSMQSGSDSYHDWAGEVIEMEKKR
jgi:hypothetical protein